MPDPRFFRARGPYSLTEIARIADVDLGPDDDPGRLFLDVAPLADAGPQDVSFLDNARYVDQYRVSGAGGCVIHPDRADAAPAGMSLLRLIGRSCPDHDQYPLYHQVLQKLC